MASICFYHLIIGIITDIKIILCDENVNVFPFLYAYFLDNYETPPTLLSIVQNQQKHSRHALQYFLKLLLIFHNSIYFMMSFTII